MFALVSAKDEVTAKTHNAESESKAGTRMGGAKQKRNVFPAPRHPATVNDDAPQAAFVSVEVEAGQTGT